MKYFANAKCEIKFAPNICEANISYALAYFIAKLFHSPKANFIEKEKTLKMEPVEKPDFLYLICCSFSIADFFIAVSPPKSAQY